MPVTLHGVRRREIEEGTARPIHDLALIKPLPIEERTIAGLWLTPATQDIPGIGDVVAVGPGRLTPEGVRVPVSFGPGDRVLFAQGAGLQVTIAGELHVLVYEHDILATLEPDES
jgi:chaperonin GroES